jgi:hypothetical protein
MQSQRVRMPTATALFCSVWLVLSAHSPNRGAARMVPRTLSEHWLLRYRRGRAHRVRDAANRPKFGSELPLVIQNPTPSGPDVLRKKFSSCFRVSRDECVSNADVFSLKDVPLVCDLAELP